jgi:hypothetical protein
LGIGHLQECLGGQRAGERQCERNSLNGHGFQKRSRSET